MIDLVRVLQRTLDVDHGQEHENKCLDERYQHSHHHHRQRNQERCKAEEDHEDQFVAVHVAEKTEGKGDDTADMADYFDKEHHRCQPENRPHEVLDVADAMLFYADYVGYHENDNSTGRCGVDIGCRRKEAGDKTDKV